MSTRRPWLPALAAALLIGATPARADELHKIVKWTDVLTVWDDVVPLTFGKLRGGTVRADGSHLALIHTYPMALSAVLRDGELVLLRADPMPGLGEPMGSCGSAYLDNQDRAVLSLTSIDLATRAVVRDEQVIVQRDQALTPGAGAAPGMAYVSFGDAVPYGTNRLLVSASIYPGSGSPDWVLVDLELDDDGVILEEQIVAQAGDMAGGQVLGAPSNSRPPAVNDTGFFAYGTSSQIVAGGVLLAAVGEPSPIPGRNWASLGSLQSEIYVNAQGRTLFTGFLDGDFATDHIIVFDGQVVAQEGDALPAMPGSVITSLTPHAVDDAGRVVWSTTVVDTTPTGSGDLHELLLVDDQIVKASYDLADGAQGFPVSGGFDVQAITPDGSQMLMALGSQTSLSPALYRLERDGAFADAGVGLSGSLSFAPRFGGWELAEPGGPLELLLSLTRPSSTSILVIGLTQLDLPVKGGVLSPSPDLLVFGLPVDGDGRLALETVWPTGVPSGAELFLQHWVTDPGGPVGFAASNGLRLTFP